VVVRVPDADFQSTRWRGIGRTETARETDGGRRETALEEGSAIHDRYRAVDTITVLELVRPPVPRVPYRCGKVSPAQQR